MRRLLDGLFYLVRTGCQWRHLPPPRAFPPPGPRCTATSAPSSRGVWESLRHHLVVMLREGEGREASPTAAIIDTQSVKTTEKGASRLGRRQEGEGAQAPRRGGHLGPAAGRGRARGRHPGRGRRPGTCSSGEAALLLAEGVFADSIYNRLGPARLLPPRPDADHRPPCRGTAGFVLLPRRWVVERRSAGSAAGAPVQGLRGATEVSEAMVTLAMIRLMLHRLAHPDLLERIPVLRPCRTS